MHQVRRPDGAPPRPGFNLAAGHKDPRVRWSLGREGWRVLQRIVERNPRAKANAAIVQKDATDLMVIRIDLDPS